MTLFLYLLNCYFIYFKESEKERVRLRLHWQNLICFHIEYRFDQQKRMTISVNLVLSKDFGFLIFSS